MEFRMRDSDRLEHDAESAQEGRAGLKINDRRRFDSSGNERDDGAVEEAKPVPKVASVAAAPKVDPVVAKPVAPKPEPVQAKTSPAATPQEPVEADDSEAGEEEDGISFTSFVVSLATQALMQIGAIPGPDGTRLTPDRHAAKQTIDIMNMITAKTKGNLTREEESLLEEINHRLRMAFLGRM